MGVDLQFAALGDPIRLRIVEMLGESPMPVHRLTAAFSVSRPAISRHLRVLKEAGLVSEEKLGRENLYQLRAARLKLVAGWFKRPAPAKPARPVAPMPAKVEPQLELSF